jgi:hypothetical protein
MADRIKPGDITVSELPHGHGFIFGRVLAPRPDGMRWEYLGGATHLPLACGFACTFVEEGRSVWVFDSKDSYRLHRCEESR